MIAVPRNPLSLRSSQPAAPVVRRTHSVAQRRVAVQNQRPLQPAGPVSGGDLGSQIPNLQAPRRNTRRDYGPLLHERLAVAQRAQQIWLDDVNSETQFQEAARQEHLRSIREERERINNEETERARRAHQERLEAQQARAAAIAEERRLEEERRQRELEERRREAEEHRRAEEEALALWEAQIVAEELRRQEEAEEAERQRRARERECT
ncbi:hypothetical protein MMC30_000552, partial [Trapelia coarctata]|nr:hypothetical protein [Trapelia coarctata]